MDLKIVDDFSNGLIFFFSGIKFHFIDGDVGTQALVVIVDKTALGIHSTHILLLQKKYAG